MKERRGKIRLGFADLVSLATDGYGDEPASFTDSGGGGQERCGVVMSVRRTLRDARCGVEHDPVRGLNVPKFEDIVPAAFSPRWVYLKHSGGDADRK